MTSKSLISGRGFCPKRSEIYNINNLSWTTVETSSAGQNNLSWVVIPAIPHDSYCRAISGISLQAIKTVSTQTF